jgi:hypothetical protein
MPRDHQFALDVHGNWVNAKKTRYSKYSVYYCDCPRKHKMKLVKPSGALGKREFCDYFAHITKRQKRAGSTTSDHHPACVSGGESILHRRAKHALRELVGSYKFAVFRCCRCGDEKHKHTEDCSVRIEVRSSDGKWRYDCLLVRGSTPVVAMEVVNTHRTGDKKAAATRASGLEIAEFRAQDVIHMMERGCGPADNGCVTLIENLQIRTGICDSCLVEDSLKWIRECYVDELHELICQEEAVPFNYARVDTLNRVLAVKPYYMRCKRLLQLAMKRRLLISIPMIGEITCSTTKLWEYGVLASGFSTKLPTHQICIFLLQQDSDACDIHWQYGSIRREFHVFLKCSTIIHRLGSLAEERVCLKDCRWAILKKLEQSKGVCANCGKFGHGSELCRVRFCLKCGRMGHLKRECFATKNFRGEPIQFQ